MSTPPDGGPAFPTRYPANDPRSSGFFTEEGMSLRDWFAGQALQGWLSGPCQGDALDDFDRSDADTEIAFRQHQNLVGKACYGYADAMLEARKAKQ